MLKNLEKNYPEEKNISIRFQNQVQNNIRKHKGFENSMSDSK